MKLPGGAIQPAYNVQFGTDVASRAIVAVDVVNTGSDAQQSAPLRQQAERRTGRPVKEHLFDGGFVNKDLIGAAESRGVAIYAPLPKNRAGAAVYLRAQGLAGGGGLAAADDDAGGTEDLSPAGCDGRDGECGDAHVPRVGVVCGSRFAEGALRRVMGGVGVQPGSLWRATDGDVAPTKSTAAGIPRPLGPGARGHADVPRSRPMQRAKGQRCRETMATECPIDSQAQTPNPTQRRCPSAGIIHQPTPRSVTRRCGGVQWQDRRPEAGGGRRYTRSLALCVLSPGGCDALGGGARVVWTRPRASLAGRKGAVCQNPPPAPSLRKRERTVC